MYSMLLLFIGLHLGQCQELIVSEQRMNWTEAAEYCMERKSTLVHPGNRPPNVTDYWTIQHKRISPWIHIIGCFNESVIHSSLNQNVTLPSASVSLCQQRCPNHTFFGLQNSSCVCILNYVSITSAIDPSLCKISCSTSKTVFNECGGEETYSIYKTGDFFLFDEDKNKSGCLAIKCYGSETFRRLECSTTSERCLCRNPDMYIANLSWIKCATICKNEGRYMHGDYDLCHPQDACSGINAVEQRTYAWIGIAKEIYQTSYIGRIDLHFLVLQCIGCNKNRCTLGSCLENKYAVCNEQNTVSTTQQSSSTSLSSTSQASASQTTELTWKAESHSATEITSVTKTSTFFSRPTPYTSVSQKFSSKAAGALNPTTIIIVASVATFTTISVVIFITLLCVKKRRGNLKERNLVHDQIHRSEIEMDRYDGIPSVVHPSKSVDHQKTSGNSEKNDRNMHCEDDYNHLHESFREKESHSSNMYSTMSNCTSERDYQTEGNEIYNHLRERSIKAAEDIYNHMIEENDCEYGLADPTANENSDVFCNYAHFILPMTLNKSHEMSNDYDKMDT